MKEHILKFSSLMIYLVVRGSIKIVAVGTTSLPKIFWPTFPNQRGECVEIILKFAERYSNIPASHPHLSINHSSY